MSVSNSTKAHAPMPTGEDVVGLEGLAYVAFEGVEQLRSRLEDAADREEWATAQEAWLLTFAMTGIEDRAESILSDARKLRDVANHLYLNAAEAGETPEYPDQIAITTTIMERIAAERRIDFPARFES